MRKISFTVGPSQLYPGVARWMKQAVDSNVPSMYHRSREFVELFSATTESLGKLLNVPDESNIFFLTSGTEAMERVVQNCAASHTYHFITGNFGNTFFEISKSLGKSAVKAETADILSQKIPSESELISITQNETSTGIAIPEKDIHELKKRDEEKIIAVDIVSSAPYVNLDYSLVDFAFFSVQKGFGLPAGLGVIIVSKQAMDKAAKLQQSGVSVGSYHSLPSLLKWSQKRQTPETPNIMNIWLLKKVVDAMRKKGITKIRSDTERKAKMIYDFFDSSDVYKPALADKKLRSKTTIVVNATNSHHVAKMLAKQGFVVGLGYGENEDRQVRIANFPAHTIGHIEMLLRAFRNL